MRAADLVEEYPTIHSDRPVIEAARVLAAADLPGLIVLDDGGLPYAVLPSSQVLRLAVPAYIVDEPTLARVVDEAAADVFLLELRDRTVRECLQPPPPELPIVKPTATLLEVAALMARLHSPLVVVVDQGRLVGAITLHRLLDSVLGT